MWTCERAGAVCGVLCDTLFIFTAVRFTRLRLHDAAWALALYGVWVPGGGWGGRAPAQGLRLGLFLGKFRGITAATLNSWPGFQSGQLHLQAPF